MVSKVTDQYIANITRYRAVTYVRNNKRDGRTKACVAHSTVGRVRLVARGGTCLARVYYLLAADPVEVVGARAVTGAGFPFAGGPCTHAGQTPSVGDPLSFSRPSPKPGKRAAGAHPPRVWWVMAYMLYTHVAPSEIF